MTQVDVQEMRTLLYIFAICLAGLHRLHVLRGEIHNQALCAVLPAMLGTSTSVPDTVQAVAWSAHRSNGYEANES